MSKLLTAMFVSMVAFSNLAVAAIDETIRYKETIEVNAPADKVWAKLAILGI